jgi:hypothetical protein
MTDKPTKIFIASTIFMFIIIMASFPVEGNSLSIHIEISELTEAHSPMFIDNHIIFTYFGGEKYIRRVAIAFETDNYKQVYPFKKNEYNVFFLSRKIPERTEYINYRLIVDGVWTHDPVNANSFLSPENLIVSSLKIPKSFSEQSTTPLISDNGNVRFTYKDQANKHIYLSGNFNNWDPFMLKMKENAENPGTYTISLRMAPGKHFYTFVSDGISIQDPNNPHKANDSRGNVVSVISLQ